MMDDAVLSGLASYTEYRELEITPEVLRDAERFRFIRDYLARIWQMDMSGLHHWGIGRRLKGGTFEIAIDNAMQQRKKK